mgnify:CR=1 FL=1
MIRTPKGHFNLESQQAFEELKNRFEMWRSTTQKGRRKVPEELWSEAVKLSAWFSLSSIAQALGIDFNTLKKKAIQQQDCRALEPLAKVEFVELSHSVFPACKNQQIAEIISIGVPQDYPQVDEALWLLEGVFDRLAEIRREDRFKMEARIVAALLKKLKGPFSKEQYSTAAHLYPRLMPGDNTFYEAVTKFYRGRFAETVELLEQLNNRGLMSSSNRISTRIMLVEARLYSGATITDDLLEEMVALTENESLTPLQSERAGYLLARYVMDADEKFSQRRVDHEGQSFSRSITGKPWAIGLTHRRGVVKRAKKPVKSRDLKEQEADEEVEREPGSLIAEVYANRPEDWVVSANMYLVTLPDLHLLGTGRIVGRESEGEGWVFKDDQIDAIRRRQRYLVIFEFDNSDSDKSLQGMLFKPR